MDASRFFATIYKDGKDVVRATVYMGGMLDGMNTFRANQKQLLVQ